MSDVEVPEGFDLPSFCREEEARLKIKYPDMSDLKLADKLADSVDYYMRTGRLMDEADL